MREPTLDRATNGEVIKIGSHTIIRRGGDGWMYKQSNAAFVANEYEMLTRMADSGYTPQARKLSDNIVAVEDLGDQYESWHSVTDEEAFMSHLPLVLDALKEAGIRHGDLTKFSVIVVDNKPMLIDFAQSRDIGDWRPDKRPEGDRYWLERTMKELCGEC